MSYNLEESRPVFSAQNINRKQCSPIPALGPCVYKMGHRQSLILCLVFSLFLIFGALIFRYLEREEYVEEPQEWRRLKGKPEWESASEWERFPTASCIGATSAVIRGCINQHTHTLEQTSTCACAHTRARTRTCTWTCAYTYRHINIHTILRKSL